MYTLNIVSNVRSFTHEVLGPYFLISCGELSGVQIGRHVILFYDKFCCISDGELSHS